jgi:hypothetical protein
MSGANTLRKVRGEEEEDTEEEGERGELAFEGKRLQRHKR